MTELAIPSSLLPPPHLALSAPVPAAPPAPRGAGWITIAEAMKRTGWKERRLRQRCQDWEREGLARKQTPASGGMPAWIIREDAHPKLARIKFADSMPFDTRHLTDEQRKVLDYRRSMLNDCEAHCKAAFVRGIGKTSATKSFADSRGISVRVLHVWHRRYRKSGAAGLVDGRSTRARVRDGATDGDNRFADYLAEVKRLYLNLRHPALSVCIRDAQSLAAEHGWEVCSDATVYRMIEEIPEAVKGLNRRGKKYFEDKFEPSIERDYSTLESNEQWVGDSHRFDVFVNCDGKICRPWLTALMDMRSRKIVGWYIAAHDPNTDSIIAAIRMGVMTHGVPQLFYFDNGRDWASQAINGSTKQQRRQRSERIPLDESRLNGLAQNLATKVRFAWSYHGQSKSIERQFGTVETGFCSGFPTYCGSTTANKPENLELQKARGNAPKLADFISGFEEWLEHGYHNRIHAGDSMDGKTPAAVFEENLRTKRTAPVELLDLLLMKTSRPVKIGKNGVVFNGLRFGQNEPAIHLRQGERVILRTDPRDATFVTVWDLEDKFICRAECNAKIPANADAQILREAIAAKRGVSRLTKQYHQARPRLHEPLPTTIHRRLAEKATANSPRPPQLPPPSIQPVQSKLADQMPALMRAMERAKPQPLRLAVGGESQGGTLDIVEVARQMRDRDAATATPRGDEFCRYVDRNFRSLK